TSDRMQLNMEARQNLGRLVDLSCCREIQVAVKSAEQRATLDLFLINTTVMRKPSVLLGRAQIQGGRVPVEKAYSFPVPTQAGQFDEIRIVFNRVFATASAKVEIERFVLVPR